MAKTKPADERERDPWFNPYRYPTTERATVAIGDALREFEEQEGRKRTRKQNDRQWLWRAGAALFADLAYHHLSGCPGAGLAVPRAKKDLGKRDRYSPLILTRSFPSLLDKLERAGYLIQTKGKFSGHPAQSKRTTIRAGAKLISLVVDNQITFDDLALSDAEEIIILKRRKRGYWDRGASITYRDNETTERFRSELKQINSWLEKVDITFDPVAADHDTPVDTRARRMYRYFAGDFESGGRLFRGFWENLPKRPRKQGLRIEGEPVVVADYAQLNPMLAYARIRCSPPPGDAYALPGLEDQREGVKKVFNALLFDTGPRKSFPKGVNELFSGKVKVGDVIRAIHERHPRLRPVLGTGAGFALMFLESEIMMRVLERLQQLDVVGLPLFDAVIVKASKADAAEAVMKAEFKRHTRMEIQVRLEGSSVPASAPTGGTTSQALSWDF